MRKKYLKTPEEVIKALKEGKEVKSDFSGYYKMIEGTFCHFFKKNIWTINQCICSTENPYIEEAEPLKFEIGNFYKNRGGNKVLLAYKGKNSSYPLCFVDQKTGDIYKLTEKGKELLDEDYVSVLDIIGEWEE